MIVNKERAPTSADFDHGPRGEKQPAAAVVGKVHMGGEVETDTESWGSSTEDGESPRSVAMWRRRKVGASGCLHSQVLRVMEEDLHLGEDIIGIGMISSGTMLTEYGGGNKPVTSGMNGGVSPGGHHHQMVVLSRPILPCSPLGGKGSTVKT